jgi:hypothetical protein
MTPAAGEGSSPKPRAALVVGVGAGASSIKVEQIMVKARERYELLDEPELRLVLEGSAATPRAEDRLRAALQRARQSLRRFEMAPSRAAITDGYAALKELAPTPEGIELAIELALRDAELAQVERDVSRQRLAMQLALSIKPDLTIDLRQYPPTLQHLLGKVSAAQRRVHTKVQVLSRPEGASIYVAGQARGAAPLELSDLFSGRHLIWAALEGYAPQAAIMDLPSDRPIELSLSRASLVARLSPLIEAVRRTQGHERREGCMALASALGVDAILFLEGDEPTVFDRREREPLTTEALAVPKAGPPSQNVLVSAPRPRRWWVAAVTAGASVALAAGATAVRVDAAQQADRARQAQYASDGQALWNSAVQRAQVSTGMFIGAGGVLATSAVLYFVF